RQAPAPGLAPAVRHTRLGALEMQERGVRLGPEDAVDRDGARRDPDAGVRDVEQALHHQHVVAPVRAAPADGIPDHQVAGEPSLDRVTDAVIVYDAVTHGSNSHPATAVPARFFGVCGGLELTTAASVRRAGRDGVASR